MKKQKRIPISVVKAFATQVGYDHVIVLAYDSKTNTECVATWGTDDVVNLAHFVTLIHVGKHLIEKHK